MNNRVHAGAFRALLLLLLAHFLLLGSFPLYAVDTHSETAGAEQSRFEKEAKLEKEAHPTEAEMEKKPAEIIEARPEPKQSLESDILFTLKDIEIVGNQSIPTEELKKQVEDRLNTEVNLNGLREVAREIKQYYRDKGYIAAYVYLPPQNVVSGAVKIAVVEGKLGKIDIKGNKWFSERVIRRSLGLVESRVVFYRDLKTALSFLNKHHDIKATSVLKPGEEAETTDLEINVRDQFPVHISTDVNNLGTENTGKNRWGVSVGHNNVLGLMDQALGRFQIGAGAWAVGADYSIPLPIYRKEPRVGFSYSRSAVDVGGPFKALNVEGQATTYGIYILQPFFYAGPFEFSANLGFDWKSVENRTLGRVSGKDEHRILNVGFNAEETDRWGKTFFPQSVHIGFADFLSGDGKVASSPTRALTGGQFAIYRASLIRYHRFLWDMMFIFRGVMQLTSDSLAPSEQMRLGGALSVRGYPEGEYLADYGAYLSSEILIPSYFFPKDWKLPFSSQPMRKQIQGVGFFDFGGAQLRRTLAGEEPDRFLAGIGGGIRAELFDHVYGRFHWASPIGSRPSDNSKDQFYFGVSAEMI